LCTAAGGLEGKCRARRHAEHERGSAGFSDHGFEVVDFALHVVRCRIAAVATAAAVVREDGEMTGQRRCHRLTWTRCPVAHRAVHEHQRRPASGAFDGDGSAILRQNLFHGVGPGSPARVLLLSTRRTSDAEIDIDGEAGL
jgi:hypothetical protein